MTVWPVPGALDGERVDRALSLLSGLSRRQVNDLLDGGRVSIADRTLTSHSHRVRSGDQLTVAGDVAPPKERRLAADAGVALEVVWSDEAVIVVDKPAGVVVHPGAGNPEGTLVQGLLARFPDLAAMAAEQPDRPGIVQRLDKGTSGLLMVARTPTARRALVAQLAGREVMREYLALVEGTIAEDAGLIDAPLGRGERDPTRMRVKAGGREARTRYEVLGRYDQPVATSFVRCRLETGRTHQIRVHLASIGHPVIGDDRYGAKGSGKWRPLPPGRPFLHAATLGFEHPVSGERLLFSAKLPEELFSVLAAISHDPVA
jgi:23S rRNA pseudouridine1911/1915/1917 synthase